MPEFSYTASDLEGQVVSGVVSAETAADAKRLITEMGLGRARIVQGKLTTDESDDLALTVADAINADLPLAEAFEAAAMEIERPKLKAALQRLAKVVRDGNTLEAALVRLDDTIPEPVAALLSASVQNGAIAHVLPDIIEQRKSVRMIWLELLMIVAYPLIVLYASLFLLAAFGVLIVAPFKEMFEEFAISLPTPTVIIIWWHDIGAWCLLGVLVFLTAAGLFSQMVVSGIRRRRLLAWVPIVGPIVHWTSISEMCGTLASMLESGLPLPEAVRYTGMSAEDIEVQLACRQMEKDLQAGALLSDAMHNTRELPPTIIPIIQWGEREGSLPDALRAYTDSIAERVRNRGRLFRLIFPMLIMLAVGAAIGFGIIALFLPLTQLIQGLI